MSSRAPHLLPLPKPERGESVSFDGTRIAYDLYQGPSRSLVLVVPGFWRDRRHRSMLALAAMLNSHGWRAAVCDPRGHGESGGTFGFNLHEHHDVAAVVSDLVSRLSVESVALIGLSYGGAIAISTAARHALPLSALVLISPVADFAMLSPKINLFTLHRHIAISQALRRPRFPLRFGRTPKLRALDDISSVRTPVCFLHVKNDWLVDHAHSVALYERANEPKELHIIDIPGNYHADRIFSIASESVEPLVADFLARTTPR
jgi:pimeloyl-ACP methyl ester carboxylesterase